MTQLLCASFPALYCFNRRNAEIHLQCRAKSLTDARLRHHTYFGNINMCEDFKHHNYLSDISSLYVALINMLPVTWWISSTVLWCFCHHLYALSAISAIQIATLKYAIISIVWVARRVENSNCQISRECECCHACHKQWWNCSLGGATNKLVLAHRPVKVPLLIM